MNEISRIKEQYRDLPQDPTDQVIENTAIRLTGMKFTPCLLIDIPNFLYQKKGHILAEVERILTLTEDQLVEEGMTLPAESEIFRMNHLKLVYYFYELLTRLRQNEPDAWNEVNELYDHD